MTTDVPIIEVETTKPPATGRLFWRDVAVGTAFEAEEAVVALLAAVRRQAAAPVQRSTDGAASLVALVRRQAAAPVERSTEGAASLVAQVRRRVAEAAERGAAEQLRARRRGAVLLDDLAASVAASSVVNRVVDVQVDRILRPLVVTVLDDVLAMLEAEPDRIQSLVRGQRDTMVDELVGHIRTGAVAGDTVVDRWTGRMFRRTHTPASPSAPAPGHP
jgi:hypothetical protein